MYQIYPTLLDAFNSYVNSDRIYDQYYGYSEDPAISPEDFSDQKKQELIDKINRVPYPETEAMAKGTSFGMLVDAAITGVAPDELEPVRMDGYVNVKYKEWNFKFEIDLIKRMKEIIGPYAECQTFVSRSIDTKYGEVNLYGYLDYLCPHRIIDLKTTKKYSAFKFRDSWQHPGYSYCISEETMQQEFLYLVTDFRMIYQEPYLFKISDIPNLRNEIEHFIEFVDDSKELIKPESKIFGL